MVFKLNVTDLDEQEALTYRAGHRVELKSRPGVVYIIAEYEPMMVPPIWLVNDPKPRYPEELTLIPKQVMCANWLNPGARRQTRSSAPQARSRQGSLQTSGVR